MSLIIGIDPGSRKTGFGIISQVGSRQEYVTSGVIRLESFPTFPERLDSLYTCLMEVINQWSPQEAAIEQVFMGRSADSALKLGQARGVAMLAATQSKLPVSEYAARKIKQAVVGKGGADKVQVQHMVQFLLKLPGLPQEDAADALAVALCHANTQAGLIRVAGSRHSRRGALAGMNVLYAIELFGVAVFAMAGALEAARNRLDLFGVLVLAFVSALGGGTLRDLLLNVSPLAWIGDVTLAYTAFGGGLLMFFLARYFAAPFKVLLYADAIGLAAFTVSGTQAALALELPGLIVVMMGMASGIFGGILRDIMANEIPLIFRRDIYATASFCGAVLVWLGHQLWPGSPWIWVAGFALVLTVRAAAIHWRLSLPGFLSTVAYRKDNHPRDL